MRVSREVDPGNVVWPSHMEVCRRKLGIEVLDRPLTHVPDRCHDRDSVVLLPEFEGCHGQDRMLGLKLLGAQRRVAAKKMSAAQVVVQVRSCLAQESARHMFESSAPMRQQAGAN